MARYKLDCVGEFGFNLVLNPMQGNIEGYKRFGVFLTREEAIAFYQAEVVESYRESGPSTFGPGDKTYLKHFRKGGPLEWFNPLTEAEFEQQNSFGHGLEEVLIQVTQINKLYPIL